MPAPTVLDNGLAGQQRRSLGVAIASLLGATLFWAGNYIVGAIALDAMSPTSLVLLRWVIALIPLFVIAQLSERPRWREVVRAWPWLVALAITGLLGYNLLLYFALEHTDAFNASLINAFNPALITIAAAMFLRERLTPTRVAGVLIALVGVFVVLTEGNPMALISTSFGAGQAFMIGAILAWTAYTVLGRRAPSIPPITATALQALIAVIALIPVTALTGGLSVPTTTTELAALLFIGLLPSVGSYLLWNRALRVIAASTAGVFLNLITVFTVVITIAMGHPANVAQLMGGAIVISGVVVTNAGAFRKRAPKRPACPPS